MHGRDKVSVRFRDSSDPEIVPAIVIVEIFDLGLQLHDSSSKELIFSGGIIVSYNEFIMLNF